MGSVPGYLKLLQNGLQAPPLWHLPLADVILGKVMRASLLTPTRVCVCVRVPWLGVACFKSTEWRAWREWWFMKGKSQVLRVSLRFCPGSLCPGGSGYTWIKCTNALSVLGKELGARWPSAVSTGIGYLLAMYVGRGSSSGVPKCVVHLLWRCLKEQLSCHGFGWSLSWWNELDTGVGLALRGSHGLLACVSWQAESEMPPGTVALPPRRTVWAGSSVLMHGLGISTIASLDISSLFSLWSCDKVVAYDIFLLILF